ncbi:MAG: cation diffusion facilitator family transporter [Holosporaceae bacterium]|jgi:ferrous-iron efflux pump FieF|nr:cation diffusion facilitator family transporter [Holosporaceae bacterium]
MFFDIRKFNSILDSRFGEHQHTELAKKSAALGVAASIFLVIIKLLALMVTNSLTMRASMMDSLLDALASFVAYHALTISGSDIDQNHNFGHDKVESIVALLQSMMVVYSGVVIYRDAYEMFFEPRAINNTGVGVLVMVLSCVTVYILLYFQRYVVQKTGSLLIKGDSLHYVSDFLMNISIIASLILSRICVYVDLVCGVVVGSYVLYNAFLIINHALRDLMDEALPAEIQTQISEIIASTGGVNGIKSLRTRTAGMRKHVETRIIVDGEMPLAEADKIAESIESKIKDTFEKVDVIAKAEAK